MITGTDFLIIGSTDVDRSVKFYGEVLGLERGKQWGNMPGYEFETGNLTIAVVQLDAFGQEFKPSTNPLEFRVEDFEAAKSELESKGVEFRATRSTRASATRRSSRTPTATCWGSITATRKAHRPPRLRER